MRILLIYFFIHINYSCFAQSDTVCHYSLSGKIIDEHDKQALGFSNIFIKGTQKGAIADENGKFSLNNLCAGKYTIVITHIGCDNREEKIEIKNNTERNFYLEHHTEELKTILIATKKPELQSTQNRTDISGNNLEETKGKLLGDALKEINGVHSLNTGSNISKPIIHGMHSNRILILNNGIRQEGQQWGSEHAPEIDPFIANNLSVIKGANSVKYGSDAMAGIVLVEPKALRDTAGIGAELNFVGASNNKQGIVSGMVEGNFNKISALSWRVQGTIKKGGNVKTPDYYLKNTGNEEYNFSWAAAFAKENWGIETFYSQFNSNVGIFSGAHIGNLTDLKKAIELEIPNETSDFSYKIDRPYQHIEHELFKTKAYIKTGEKSKLNFIYARQYNLRNEFDKHKPKNNSLASLNKPELSYEITTHTSNFDWEHFLMPSIIGNIGLSGMYQANTYEGRYLIPNYENYSGGVFLIERLRKRKYEIEAGIRYDQRNLTVYRFEDNTPIITKNIFNNATGNIGFIYKPDSSIHFFFNAGKAWRAPNINELYSEGLHHGAAAIEYGDKNLKPENAYNFIITAQYNSAKKNISAEVTGYYNLIDNFIYLSPELPPVLTIRGAFPTFRYKQTNSSFKGIDAQASYWPIKKLQIIGKASLLIARDENNKDFLVLIPSNKYEGKIKFILPDLKNLTNTYVSTEITHTAKQWRVDNTKDFAPTPDAYTLLNVYSNTTFIFHTQAIEIGIGVDNLLNVKYRDYLDRFRYYTDSMGRNVTARIKIPINYSPKQKSK